MSNVEVSYQEEPGRDYRAERDAAYVERNKVVAGLAAMIIKAGGRAWLADHRDVPGESWDPNWRTVVFIDGPTGQLSWHLHDHDVVHFRFLPRGENEWDGHTSEAKYQRIAEITKTLPLGHPFITVCRFGADCCDAARRCAGCGQTRLGFAHQVYEQDIA